MQARPAAVAAIVDQSAPGNSTAHSSSQSASSLGIAGRLFHTTHAVKSTDQHGLPSINAVEPPPNHWQWLDLRSNICRACSTMAAASMLRILCRQAAVDSCAFGSRLPFNPNPPTNSSSFLFLLSLFFTSSPIPHWLSPRHLSLFFCFGLCRSLLCICTLPPILTPIHSLSTNLTSCSFLWQLFLDYTSLLCQGASTRNRSVPAWSCSIGNNFFLLSTSLLRTTLAPPLCCPAASPSHLQTHSQHTIITNNNKRFNAYRS